MDFDIYTQILDDLGVGQSDVARCMGVSLRTVYRWKTAGVPKVVEFWALSTYLLRKVVDKEVEIDLSNLYDLSAFYERLLDAYFGLPIASEITQAPLSPVRRERLRQSRLTGQAVSFDDLA